MSPTASYNELKEYSNSVIQTGMTVYGGAKVLQGIGTAVSGISYKTGQMSLANSMALSPGISTSVEAGVLLEGMKTSFQGSGILMAESMAGSGDSGGKRGKPSEGTGNPVNVKTPDLKTGVGYDAGDVPVRIDGEWSVNDMKQGLLGHPPRGLDSPDIHHGGQMAGGALHEVVPSTHRNNPALHPNKYNQGVTPKMRASDRQLHWWYRAREQGADQILSDWIYDK